MDNNFHSDAEAPGIETVGDQKFCSYSDYNCSARYICKEQWLWWR